MKQFLVILTVAGAIACVSTPASAALPNADLLPLELETASNLNATDTMLAQCYGGGGGYYYPPVQQTYYRSAPAVSVRVGGGRGYGRGYGGGGYGGGYGYRSGYRGYGGGYGGGGFGGYGRGFGRSGVGLFLSF